MQKNLFLLISILLLSGCGVPPEDWHKTHLEEELMVSMDVSLERWIVASQYLPKEKLQGLQNAGFFELKEGLYSHHCDAAGNMIRLKYVEDKKAWKQIKYESLGCGDDH